jgi:hypothetical protein
LAFQKYPEIALCKGIESDSLAEGSASRRSDTLSLRLAQIDELEKNLNIYVQYVKVNFQGAMMHSFPKFYD